MNNMASEDMFERDCMHNEIVESSCFVQYEIEMVRCEMVACFLEVVYGL